MGLSGWNSAQGNDLSRGEGWDEVGDGVGKAATVGHVAGSRGPYRRLQNVP